ncbi:MAG: hypothetical protein AB8G05_10825 [Oligoflexales bacterium]
MEAKLVDSFEDTESDKGNLAKIFNLQKIIRDVSSIKFSQQANDEIMKIESFENQKASMLNQWLTLILISGTKIKICFKSHFSNTSVRAHLAHKFDNKDKNLTLEMGFDLLKEYCNLVGGGIKECLVSDNRTMGLSLPLLTRGFDEVLFVDRMKRSNKRLFRDIWRLSTSYNEIICSSEIYMIDWSSLDDVDEPKTQREAGGELEFL